MLNNSHKILVTVPNNHIESDERSYGSDYNPRPPNYYVSEQLRLNKFTKPTDNVQASLVAVPADIFRGARTSLNIRAQIATQGLGMYGYGFLYL